MLFASVSVLINTNEILKTDSSVFSYCKRKLFVVQ